MPKSVLWPSFALLVVVLVRGGEALRVVLITVLAVAAGAFVLRATAYVRRQLGQPFPGQTTGGAACPGAARPLLRPLVPASVSGSPTQLTVAGPRPCQGRGMNVVEPVAIAQCPESGRNAVPCDGSGHCCLVHPVSEPGIVAIQEMGLGPTERAGGRGAGDRAEYPANVGDQLNEFSSPRDPHAPSFVVRRRQLPRIGQPGM